MIQIKISASVLFIEIQWLFSGSGHSIRKIVSVNSSDVKFGVHLNFPSSNQLCVLQPQVSSGRLHITHVASVYGPQVGTQTTNYN